MIDIKSTHKSPSSGGRLVIIKSDEDAEKYRKSRQAKKKNKKNAGSKTTESKPKVMSPVVYNETEKKQVRKVPKENYAEQLKDPIWKLFREFVLGARGHRCERCGSSFSLQIHHMLYRSGTLAWEYTCNDVIVLCEKCHKQAHGIIA